MLRPASLFVALSLAACGGASTPPAPPPTPPPPAAPVDAGARMPEPALSGTWRGTLGGRLRLVFTLTRADGKYSGSLESVDQGVTLPVDRVKVEGDAVRMEVDRVGGVYEGKLDAKQEKLAGSWTQSGHTNPLELARGGPAEASPAASAPRPKPLDVPLDVVVPVAPAALRAEGMTHLVYELHITNFSAHALTLKKIEATNADTKAKLGALEGRELAESLQRPGAGALEAAQRVVVGAGLRAVVYMWLDLPETAKAPTAVEHVVRVALEDGGEDLSLTVPRVAIATEPAFVAGPPLRGGDWVAGNGPSHTSRHRRAIVPVGGRAHIAQRFAIDWVKVRDGKTFAGDATSNASYFCYGVDALAMADGVVVETKDGIAENTPGKTADAVTLENIAGNHVVLDFGKHRFALYAHFKPGSLKVKLGDRVKRGQVLGLVGNSGNSTEPHLHVHVSDGVSPLGSEGVPWVIDGFESHASKETAFKKSARELPLENALVRFAP